VTRAILATAVGLARNLAIASSFWVGIAAAIVAVIVVVFIPEVPMRATFEMPQAELEPEPG
jgi:hypothetical protein